MLTSEGLEDLLRRWGRMYGGFAREDAEAPPLGAARHPLDVARDYAPGSRKAVLGQRLALDRAGQGRRTLLASNAGGRDVIGYRIIPAAFVDPVRCSATRPKPGQPWRRVTPVPADIARVNAAVADLEQMSMLRAEVLRVQYFTVAPQAVKAEEVGARLHIEVKLNRFRDELAHARTWVHGRLAAAVEVVA